MDKSGTNKGSFVSDLRPGDRVTGFFLVRQKQLEPFRDRSKGEFLTLMLADRTGQILARVWEGAPALAETFALDDLVKVSADVNEYRGRPQLIIQRLRRATEDEVDLSDFLAATTRDTSAMLAEVTAAVGSLRNPHLAALVREFFDNPDFVTTLAQAPASRRLHHAYLGGWLEHLTQMLALGQVVAALHPELDGELLLAGTLLLSVGKLREHTWTRDIDYTAAGQLLGQVVLGDETVAAAIARQPDFPPELALRVRHMLVGHRGRYEWGAPRPPMTLEAIALHHIDSLNTQVSRFRDLLTARREPGQPWTGFDRLLGRQLYAGADDGLEASEEPGEDQEESDE
jgi:3'-5' exoribonuclease